MKSSCGIVDNNKVTTAFIVNFSRMGAAVSTQFQLEKKKYVEVMYQNEKNELVKMLTYVVHSVRKGNGFVSGLQFVGKM